MLLLVLTVIKTTVLMAGFDKLNKDHFSEKGTGKLKLVACFELGLY